MISDFILVEFHRITNIHNSQHSLLCWWRHNETHFVHPSAFDAFNGFFLSLTSSLGFVSVFLLFFLHDIMKVFTMPSFPELTFPCLTEQYKNEWNGKTEKSLSEKNCAINYFGEQFQISVSSFSIGRIGCSCGGTSASLRREIQFRFFSRNYERFTDFSSPFVHYYKE